MNTYGAVCGNDVELIKAVPDGYDAEIQQLSAGPLGLHVEWADLPGVSIQRHRFAAALRWEEQRIEEGLSLAVPLSCERPLGVHGAEVMSNDVVLQPFGIPLEYIIPPHMTALGIQVARDLTRSLGWSVSRVGPLVFRTSGEAMQAFVGVCGEAIRTTKQWGDLAPAPQVQTALRDLVLARLAILLEPWLDEDPCRHGLPGVRREYFVVKRAELWYESRPRGEKLGVSDMASALAVPMRSLQRAFTTWTGMSPGRYFSLCRLHEFRKLLGEVGPISGAVTRAATDAGFDHLGRLARDYRELFGETPSESLYRWEKRSGGVHLG